MASALLGNIGALFWPADPSIKLHLRDTFYVYLTRTLKHPNATEAAYLGLQVGRQHDSIPLVAGKLFAGILRPKDNYRKYLARNASASVDEEEDGGADVMLD